MRLELQIAQTLLQTPLKNVCALASLTGSNVAYPAPIVLLATLEKGLPISGAVVTATVKAPNGDVKDLTLTDDGVPPDAVANDGAYSAIFDYTQNGVYEVDYIKEGGKWKLHKVHWCMTFHAPWGESFVPAERRFDRRIDRPYQRNPELKPVGAPEETLWPSGFICPFHFDNPVSGRKGLK